jgi:protein TonB
MFPFVSQAQTAPDSPGITVNAGATLLHRTPVSAPPRLSVSGTVIVDATLDAKGEVSDARVLSGPDELRKFALASVLQWHYQAGPTHAQIAIQFAGAPAAAAKSVESVGGGGRSGAPPPRPPQSLAPLNGTIKSIQFSGISAEAEEELRQKLEVREGDVVNQTELLRLGDLVSAFDSHLVLTHTTGGGEGTPEYHLQVRAPGAMVVGGAAVAVPADAPVPSGAQRVSPAIQAQKLLSHPTPIYPPLAKSARVQGAVTFQAIIGVDGTMQNLQVLSADSPLLVQSAMDAVKQWTYSPTLLNGVPVMVVTTITVNFTLAN